MKNTNLENHSIVDFRFVPRIVLNKPKAVSGDIQAKLLDLSNKGMSFITTTAGSEILNTNIDIEVQVLSEILKFTVRPVWTKMLDHSTARVFGASILDADAATSKYIVKLMIYEQARQLARHIKSIGSRRQIMRFYKELGRYAFTLAKLNDRCEARIVSESDALLEFSRATDRIVLAGEALKQGMKDKLLLAKVKEQFRNIVSPWAYKSLIVKHSYDKPRGYPGDYETLEVIYDKRIISSKYSIGRLYDIYFLNNPYADAVRNRKEYIRNSIADILKSDRRTIKILNLACGSSREIREGFLSNLEHIKDKEINITCLDWEDDALAYSASKLKDLPSNVKIEWLKEDILRYGKSNNFFEERGKFDLIYSIGLADYLPDRVIKRIIQTSYNGLNEKGTLILAHKNKEIAFSHLPPEWFCDWEFIPRNESEVMNLFYSLNLPNSVFNVDWDSPKDVFFINVHRGSKEINDVDPRRSSSKHVAAA